MYYKQNKIWKDLIYQNINYGNRLQISNYGDIKNINTNHIYKLYNIGRGYLGVCISLGSRKNKKCFRAHKAVAESFISNPFNYAQVNHKDGNKHNNYIENLEWCNNSQNQIHAINTGLRDINKISKENNGRHKLTQFEVDYIRNNYIPKDNKYGCRALARKFNVHHKTIEDIVNNKKWKI